MCASCRGLAHVCGYVLVVMGLGREEEAFWVVTALLEDKLFPHCGAQVRPRTVCVLSLFVDVHVCGRQGRGGASGC